MNTLHLTPAERPLFDALPATLREGWKVEHEGRGFVDTPERMELRLALLRIHDPKLLQLRQRTQEAQTVDEVAAAIASMDLSEVDDDDLASLFFALGPDYLSRLIIHLLQKVQTDKDVEDVTGLTVIRHSILEAFHSVSHKS